MDKINSLKFPFSVFRKLPKYIGYLVLANFSFAIIRVTLIELDLYNEMSHPSLKVIDFDNLQSILFAALTTVILHPIYEECAFRLFLRPTKRNVIIGTNAFIALCVIFIWGNDLYQNVSIFNFGRLNHSILFFITMTPSLILLPAVKISKNISPVIYNLFNSKYMIVTSSMFFSFFHIGVIGEPRYLALYIPLLLPYFVMGLIDSKARIKFGFLFAIILHSSYNLLLLLLNTLFE